MDISANQFGFALAITAVLLTVFVPKITRAVDGHYTTTTESTSTSSTDAATGVTTTSTTTSTQTPRGIYSTGHTSDIEARYPYDNTDGENRSDVDAVRTGFDDPRNPWDGRYMNDNPSSYSNSDGNRGANATVNSMQGDSGRYSPGRYGTYVPRRAGR